MLDGCYELYCNSESDFICVYIFLGGYLSSVGAMKSVSSRGFVFEGYDDIGLYYVVILWLWCECMMYYV